MGKPVQRAPGVWGVQFKHAGERHSGTFATKRDAEIWQARRQAELRAEADGTSGDLRTLGEALNRYREEISPGHKGERWERVRILALLSHPKMPVTLPLAQVRPEHIIAWRDDRLKEVKASTVLRDMNLLSAIFSHTVREWRWLKASPIPDVTRPPGGKHRERVITRQEVRTLLRALGYRPLRRPTALMQITASVFLFALRTGMRSSEITGLTWGRVQPTWVELLATKNDDARNVPLSRAARRQLAALRGLDDARPFPVDASTRDTLFRKAREKAGLSGFTFHDTRHTAATRIGATVGQPGKLTFPEFCKVFGWRDPKHALIYVNPSAAALADKMG